MKKCPRCGFEVKNDEKYCPHCGLDLQGRYRPIKKKNKAMTYLIYVIIIFSFILVPLIYSRILNNILDIPEITNEEKVALKDYDQDVSPTIFIASFDTLANFNDQFTNVDHIVSSIENYETSLTQKGDYVYDKSYSIKVLDNYNIYFKLTYTTKINDQISVKIVREYDRAHTYNTEKVIVKKAGAKEFQDLLLNEDELKIVTQFTGEQTTTSKLMDDFSKRENEFNAKKKKLGHYGIGEYDGESSFVAHRINDTYYSELTYTQDLDEYIS